MARNVLRRRASLGTLSMLLVWSRLSLADDRPQAAHNMLGIAEPVSAPDVSPTASDAPGASSLPTPDRFDESKIQSLPVGVWTDVDGGCRVLTTFSSSGEGCAVGLRRGRIAYFHTALGFYSTPTFERYARYPGTTTTSTSTQATAGVTIIDPARATVYYWELGPGVAIWPTRQLNVRIEGGGYIGTVANKASLVVQSGDADSFTLGAFAGVGLTYRLPSRPWAFGFDYRITTVSYGGLGSAEDATADGVELGHKLIGAAHSFGLSAIVRFEDDRSN